MDLIYKKADKNDIDALINLKIKQSIYNNSDIALKNEEEERKTIKNVLLQELNKTIHFFIAIDKNTNQTIASNGVIIHQMVPSELYLNGKKAYITSVYTEEEYRKNGIQKELMKRVLNFTQNLGCNKIELDASNPYAIDLYKKFGFKKDEKKYVLTNI